MRAGMGSAIGSTKGSAGSACLSAQAGRGQAGRVKKTGTRRGGSRSVKAGRPLLLGAAEGGVELPVAREGGDTRERLGIGAEEMASHHATGNHAAVNGLTTAIGGLGTVSREQRA